MPYFLHDGELETGLDCRLTGEEAVHALNSRRLFKGDRIELQDSAGRRFAAEIVGTSRNALEARVLEAVAAPPPSPLRLVLCLALVKDKALELTLQKATELGVDEIRVFASKHSPKPLPAPAQAGALARWQRIAVEACKQCGRALPPALSYHDSLRAMLGATGASAPLPADRWLLTLCPADRAELSRWAAGAPTAAALLVGPEGGLPDAEQQTLLAESWRPLGLGPRILRAETAAIAGVSLLQHLAGDLYGGA